LGGEKDLVGKHGGMQWTIEAEMWLDVKELSSYLKLKQKTIYHMVANGSIPHYRLSKLIRFKQEEIDAWMESKKAVSLEKQVDKNLHSIYTPFRNQVASRRQKR